MKIAAASEQSGISADTLRYYERVGLLPRINRTSSGIRDYTNYDLGRIKFIKHLRAVGIPIEELIYYFQLLEQGDATLEARKAILITERNKVAEKIADMQATLNLLDHKIDVYESTITAREREIIVDDSCQDEP